LIEVKEDPMMKIALAMFAAAAVLAGCTHSDQAPPPEVATPTSIPVEEGTIAEMDFESGEVAEGAATEPAGAEATPEPQ